MAIYHLSAKIISRSAGRSATAAAAYRSASSITDERTGLVHDFTKKRGVISREILAPSGAPDWTRDRASLWNYVELAETRKDAQVAREIEVALPRELTPAARIELVRGFVHDEFVSKGMIADICHHAPDAENPHAHILLTTRVLDGQGFGKKAREWNSKPQLEAWRSAWAEHANRALAAAHSHERIDSRSNADRGIDARPTVHLGPQAAALERDGIRTSAGDMNRRALAHNSELAQAKAKVVEHAMGLQEAHAERFIAELKPEAWGAFRDATRHPEPIRDMEAFLQKIAATDVKSVRERAGADWDREHTYAERAAATRHPADAAAAVAVSSPLHARWWVTTREKRRELTRQAETTRPAFQSRTAAVEKAGAAAEARVAQARKSLGDISASRDVVSRHATQARDVQDMWMSAREQEAAREAAREAQRQAEAEAQRQAQIADMLDRKAADIQRAISRGDDTQVTAKAYIRESVKASGDIWVARDVPREVVRAIAVEVFAESRKERFLLEGPEQVEIANDAIKEAREEREHERELARERAAERAREREQERDGPELEM